MSFIFGDFSLSVVYIYGDRLDYRRLNECNLLGSHVKAYWSSFRPFRPKAMYKVKVTTPGLTMLGHCFEYLSELFVRYSLVILHV